MPYLLYDLDYNGLYPSENNSYLDGLENEEDEKSYLSQKRKLSEIENNGSGECLDKNENSYKNCFIDEASNNKEFDVKIPSKEINVKINSSSTETLTNKIKEGDEKELKNENEKNNNEEENNNLSENKIQIQKVEEKKEKDNNEKKNLGKTDYFYPKLWVFIRHIINIRCKECTNNPSFNLNSPIRELETLNLRSLYIYLNSLSIGNLSIMTPEIKYEFDKLLKIQRRKRSKFIKKEESYAIKLLLKNKKYINNEETSENIKLSLIELLKDLGYKSKSEFIFFKKDKINFTKLLYKEEITKQRKIKKKIRN